MQNRTNTQKAGKKKAPVAKKRKTDGKKTFDKAAFVEKLLAAMAAKLEQADAKPTLADFVRLLQLEKEIEDEKPDSIEVKWVDPEEQTK